MHVFWDLVNCTESFSMFYFFNLWIYFYSLIFNWSSRPQKHLVEKNICLAFSSVGFRNPGAILVRCPEQSMEQQQKRSIFPQTSRNIPHHTHLNGYRQTWGRVLKGLSRTTELLLSASSRFDPSYMCMLCPNKWRQNGKELRTGRQGTQIPIPTLLVTCCRTLSKVLGLCFISYKMGRLA